VNRRKHQTSISSSGEAQYTALSKNGELSSGVVIHEKIQEDFSQNLLDLPDFADAGVFKFWSLKMYKFILIITICF